MNKEKEQIELALQQLQTSSDKPNKSHSNKTKIFIYGCIFIALVFFSFLTSNKLPFAFNAENLIDSHYINVALIIFAVLIIGELIIFVASRHIQDDATQFNFDHVINFIVFTVSGFIVLSIFSHNWTASLVSLGVISLVLGVALQAPLSNLFAWFYILIRRPYRIGDRIRINDATGDVIDVGYLDTTLWEFGGQYLSSDHPSGRIIKFPNSMVLTGMVFNYSWALFPYIWNEVKVYVSYDSDLAFVSEVLTHAAELEIGDDMSERVNIYRQLLEKTPVDDVSVTEKPMVLFRTHENTWIVAIVRYLVEPKQAGRVKTNILKYSLEKLNEQPERVKFPASNAR
jgi:small-conductance mechanosensitive channel